LAKGPDHFVTGERIGASTKDHCDGSTKAELVVMDIEGNAELSLPENVTKRRSTAITDGPTNGHGEPVCNDTGISQREKDGGPRNTSPDGPMKEAPADVGYAFALPKTPLTETGIDDFPSARRQVTSPPNISSPTPPPRDPPATRFPSPRELPSRKPTPVNKRPLVATMQPGCRSRADSIDRFKKPRVNHTAVFTLERQNRAKVQYMIKEECFSYCICKTIKRKCFKTINKNYY